jgi:hypothetical protein
MPQAADGVCNRVVKAAIIKRLIIQNSSWTGFLAQFFVPLNTSQHKNSQFRDLGLVERQTEYPLYGFRVYE